MEYDKTQTGSTDLEFFIQKNEDAPPILILSKNKM